MFDLSLTHDRNEVVDFAYPYMISPLTFVTSLPQIPRKSSFFYDVFEPSVWLCCMIVMLIFYIMLKNISTYSHDKFRIWTLVEILFRQNYRRKCKFKSRLMRALTFRWVYLCYLITMFYSNCIYSILIKPAKIQTIDTVDQLVQANLDDKLEIFMGPARLSMISVSVLPYYSANIGMPI